MSKIMDRRDLIIESPDLQTLWMKYSYSVLTLMFWVLWIYLWIPFVSLVAWLMGFHFFYEHMITLGGYKGFLRLLSWYSIGVALMSGTLIGWARYNLYRFRGREKRKSAPPVTLEDTARFFQIDEEGLAQCRLEKTTVVLYDEDGKLRLTGEVRESL